MAADHDAANIRACDCDGQGVAVCTCEKASAATRQGFAWSNPDHVAALFVETDGTYFNLPGVDPWDEKRDARLYEGPYPVVAHPPCNVWGQLAPVNEARYGKPVGHDKGCFAAALEAVETYGGVLEHPAYTLAWHAFDLDRPRRNSWQRSRCGWVTEVSQSAYGHKARKRTWLYYVGPEPPALDWRDLRGEMVIGGGINTGQCQGRPKLEKRHASRTPDAFRDLLLDLARLSATEEFADAS